MAPTTLLVILSLMAVFNFFYTEAELPGFAVEDTQEALPSTAGQNETDDSFVQNIPIIGAVVDFISTAIDALKLILGVIFLVVRLLVDPLPLAPDWLRFPVVVAVVGSLTWEIAALIRRG